MHHFVTHSRARISALLAAVLLLAAMIPLTGALSTLSAAADGSDSGSSANTDNPLQGKKVLFVGDSICEAICEQGDPTYGKTMGWAGRIMANNEMTGINLGYSGASVSNCRGTNTVISQLKRMSGRKYDYVILHGGTNDAWDKAPVGAMTEGFDGPFDVSTFAGGLEDMISYAKKTYPTAYIGYIINFRFYRTDIGYLAQMSNYVNATIAICEKWEIPYLDLYHDNDFNLKVLKSNTFTNLPDMIHPNSSGYNLLTPVIEDWMKTLSVQDDPIEESSEEPSAEPVAEESIQSTDLNSTADNAGECGLPLWVVLLITIATIAAVAVVIITSLAKKK